MTPVPPANDSDIKKIKNHMNDPSRVISLVVRKLVARLNQSEAERDRFQKLAEHYSDMVKTCVGQTPDSDEDGEPLGAGKSAFLHLKDTSGRLAAEASKETNDE